MKRIIITLILLLFLFQAAYADMPPEIPVQTEESYTVNASLPVVEYMLGDEVYINIEIDADEVKGFEVVFEYDSAFLLYKSVSVDTGEISDEENIKVEQKGDNKVLYAFTTTKDNKIDSSDKLCTINFVALKNGNTSVSIKSAKIVFDDMRYYLNTDLNKVIDIKLGKEEVKKPLGGGGGGGGGGGFYVKPEPESEKEAVEETNPTKDTNTNVSEDIAVNEIIFTDLKEDFWGYEEICYLAEKGVIKGYVDNSFKPDKSITRAEFAKMLILAADITADMNYENIFADIYYADWFAEYVLAAAKLNIFIGDENNCFNPNNNITREDAATALSRYISKNNVSIDKIRDKAIFADFEEISYYALEHVDHLFELGIINGEDNSFYPQNNITRAEASAMIYRTVVR